MFKIVDRYILWECIKTQLFSLLALCSIMIVVDLMENLGPFLDQQAPARAIVEYYLYFLPNFMKLLFPVSILLAILFTIGRLSSQNEITAMRSGGMSILRLTIPVFVFALVLSLFQIYFSGWVVPQANEKKAFVERKYLRRGNYGNTVVYNLYFRDTPDRNVLMQFYDGSVKSGNGVSIEEYSGQVSPRIKKRYDVSSIRWNDSSSTWVAGSGLVRTFNGEKVDCHPFSGSIKLELRHAQIMQLQKGQEMLTFEELRSQIDLLERGGKDVRKQRIDYYGQYAFCFAGVIISLFAVPFASVKKRGGIAAEIGAAMVISFAYLAFTKIGQSIGANLQVSPVVIGWMPNLLFLLVAIVNMFRIRQ